MRIALIAHDNKKEDMIRFTTAYRDIFEQHELYATGTTGSRINQEVSLPVHCFNSGPLGGDQEIGALVSRNEMDMIIFFRDPLTSQPHEPDVNALIRLCDVYQVPLATNMGTAEVIIRGLKDGYLDWRKLDETKGE
ncbi:MULTISPECIES: methylglyoxal synthase [Bacillaceae]|uniref:Methylglyoxal synthase n=1 Tax=Peribacillus huizhouensis TaxID=1501239 RepID=A0ABR6CS66_9BACI|nr:MULTISPECIES: methylglyoxal synthase [Bacillaceae]MBA9027789.1 methylglyoxal synthase [Peribacillus huizhouensis]